jgi:flagellar biosynthetic protein FliQ
MEQIIISMAQQALLVVLYLSAPVALSALVTGFCISLFQATTQLQEQTLSYVPKLTIVCLVLILFGRWMLALLVLFASACFEKLPESCGW